MPTQSTELDSSQEIEDLVTEAPLMDAVAAETSNIIEPRNLRSRASMPSLTAPVPGGPEVATHMEPVVPAKRATETSPSSSKKKQKKAAEGDTDDLGLVVPTKKDAVIHGNIQTLAKRLFTVEDGVQAVRTDLATAVERLSEALVSGEAAAASKTNTLAADISALRARFETFLPALNKSVESHNNLVAVVEQELTNTGNRATSMASELGALSMRLTTLDSTVAQLTQTVNTHAQVHRIQPTNIPGTDYRLAPSSATPLQGVTSPLTLRTLQVAAANTAAGGIAGPLATQAATATGDRAGPQAGHSRSFTVTDGSCNVCFGPIRNMWIDKHARRQFEGVMTAVWTHAFRGGLRSVTMLPQDGFVRVAWATSAMAHKFVSAWATRPSDYYPNVNATMAEDDAAWAISTVLDNGS